MEKAASLGVEDRPPASSPPRCFRCSICSPLWGIIAVPLVFGGALRCRLADQIVALVNNAALLGIVTIIQCRGVGPVGIRLPLRDGHQLCPLSARASAWDWSMGRARHPGLFARGARW